MSAHELKIDISRAELHGPVNLGGKNHPAKIRHSEGVSMSYCLEHKQLHVHYNGEDGIIPSANIALLVPVKHKKKAEPKPLEQAPPSANPAIKAQASGPQDHVFAGPGHGKTKS